MDDVPSHPLPGLRVSLQSRGPHVLSERNTVLPLSSGFESALPPSWAVLGLQGDVPQQQSPLLGIFQLPPQYRMEARETGIMVL